METKEVKSETRKVKVLYRTKRYGSWKKKEIQVSKTIDKDNVWKECRTQIMKELEVDYVEIQMN